MDRQTANSLEAILHTLNDDNTQFVITETPDGACTLTLVIRNDSTISMVWINQALVICRDFDTTGGK